MRAVTVIGPSHSGKTTLTAALAALEGGGTERAVLYGGAAATRFQFMGDDWAIFDIPGGQDNLALAGAALAACDAAVLCVPPDVEGAVLSAPYLRLLEESSVPTFLFINRMDAATDRISDIVSGLQPYCAHGIILRQVPMREGGQIVGAIDLISERAWEYHDGARSSLVELPDAMARREAEARSDLLETLADFDDSLLEQIIEDQRPLTDDIYEVATKVLQHHDLVPALLGSAEHGNGILRLMKSLRHEVPGVEALCDRMALDPETRAVGVLADTVKHLGKTVLVRALGGEVTGGARLGGDTVSSLARLDTRTQVPHLMPGEIGLTIKSDHIAPGRFLGEEATDPLPEWASALIGGHRRMIRPLHDKDEGKLSAALTRLSEIDPGLTVAPDAATGHPVLTTMGGQHLRRVVEKLAQSFGIEVECSEVPTALRETIRKGMEKHYRHRKQSGGAGQFADVVIDLRPLPLGSGFAFDETVKGGVVPRNYIPSVEAGARDALAKGPAGHPVVDVGVTLKDGKAHAVDSSDFAFRTAGQAAVREALAEIGTRVLQPIMKLHIHVPSTFAGGLVQIVSGLKGQVLGFEGHPTANGWDVFRALLPMSALEDLEQALGSATRGTAWFASELDHYEELRTPAKTGA